MSDVLVAERPPIIAKTVETARYLRCSEPMVRELIRTGRLHAIKVGRSIRVPRESIEAFVAGTGGAK